MHLAGAFLGSTGGLSQFGLAELGVWLAKERVLGACCGGVLCLGLAAGYMHPWCMGHCVGGHTTSSSCHAHVRL
jgi:hypothetical protein